MVGVIPNEEESKQIAAELRESDLEI